MAAVGVDGGRSQQEPLPPGHVPVTRSEIVAEAASSVVAAAVAFAAAAAAVDCADEPIGAWQVRCFVRSSAGWRTPLGEAPVQVPVQAWQKALLRAIRAPTELLVQSAAALRTALRNSSVQPQHWQRRSRWRRCSLSERDCCCALDWSVQFEAAAAAAADEAAAVVRTSRRADRSC